MVSCKKLLQFVVVISIFLLYSTSLSSAYDDVHGVELDDIVDLSFDRIIDGKFYDDYDDENPFQLTVNPTLFNENLVNALIGMKVGEVKPSIKWTVEGEDGTEEIEYIDTKIVKLVKDASPSTSPIGQIILTIFEVILGIGVVIGAVFLYLKVIRPRFLSKKCLVCGKTATAKCSKCDSFICSDCTVKGCSTCGSQKYIRL